MRTPTRRHSGALELARRYQEKGPEAWALYLLAASQKGSPRAQTTHVRDTYLDALRRSEALGMRPLSAHCHLGLGRLYHRRDRDSEAKVELSRAVDLYRQMDMQFFLKQAESDLQAIN